MSRFVDTEPVPVFLPEDPANVIYIKPRMDLGTNAAVRSAMMKTTMQVSTGGGSVPKSASVGFDLAAYNLAILTNNIVRWKGPDFDHMPCNADSILSMDPDDPLLDKVLQEINERNKPRAKSPNSYSANGNSGSTPTIAQNSDREESRQPSPEALESTTTTSS